MKVCESWNLYNRAFKRTQREIPTVVFTEVAGSEDYSTRLIKDCMHILKVMRDPPSTMKKREKLQNKGQQQEKPYSQDPVVMDTELSKGAESESERSTKRPGTGA